MLKAALSTVPYTEELRMLCTVTSAYLRRRHGRPGLHRASSTRFGELGNGVFPSSSEQMVSKGTADQGEQVGEHSESWRRGFLLTQCGSSTRVGSVGGSGELGRREDNLLSLILHLTKCLGATFTQGVLAGSVSDRPKYWASDESDTTSRNGKGSVLDSCCPAVRSTVLAFTWAQLQF